nr:hypothetical protein [Halobaculum salinum]
MVTDEHEEHGFVLLEIREDVPFAVGSAEFEIRCFLTPVEYVPRFEFDQSHTRAARRG